MYDCICALICILRCSHCHFKGVKAMDIAELDTKPVTAVENNCLFGLVYKSTSGMG